MTETNSDSQAAAKCPFGGETRSLPTDGTPLMPSPQLGDWRAESTATPLTFSDGHLGWIVTGHELARKVLEDDRFSQLPQRMPGSSALGDVEAGIDDQAQAALHEASLLSLDAHQHSKIRRTILGNFALRSVRKYQPEVAAIVGAQLRVLRAQGSPADLTEHFAEPISTAVHALVLGIPERFRETYSRLYIHESPNQVKFDFIREVLAAKALEPGDDVLSELLGSELSGLEIEGLAFTLFISGRDSVAYMIATSTVALLTHPDQLAALHKDPELISGAVEEFMRFGSMFVTLFPRTAMEDVSFGDIKILSGQTVSVSQVAANRDGTRFEDPDRFDVTRDAFGHIGFGHGIHGCVGQQLARIEIKEAITQLLAAMPNLTLVEAEQTTPRAFANPVATYEAGSVLVGWN